jgi:hypothetical protein
MARVLHAILAVWLVINLRKATGTPTPHGLGTTQNDGLSEITFGVRGVTHENLERRGH